MYVNMSRIWTYFNAYLQVELIDACGKGVVREGVKYDVCRLPPCRKKARKNAVPSYFTSSHTAALPTAGNYSVNTIPVTIQIDVSLVIGKADN